MLFWAWNKLAKVCANSVTVWTLTDDPNIVLTVSAALFNNSGWFAKNSSKEHSTSLLAGFIKISPDFVLSERVIKRLSNLSVNLNDFNNS